MRIAYLQDGEEMIFEPVLMNFTTQENLFYNLFFLPSIFTIDQNRSAACDIGLFPKD